MSGVVLALSLIVAGAPGASADDPTSTPASAAEWREWSADRIAEASATDWEQYATDRGCLYESGEVAIQVNTEANLQMGAPADLALPAVALVLDCTGRDDLEAQGRATVTPLATTWLACKSNATTLGGKLCIGKNGTWVEGEYTRNLNAGNFTGFVNLYKRITTSYDCSTNGRIADNISKTIGGGGTLLAVAPNAPTNYRYSAYLWQKNFVGSTPIDGVCTNI